MQTFIQDDSHYIVFKTSNEAWKAFQTTHKDWRICNYAGYENALVQKITEIPCITVVVTNNQDEQVYKHFISATLAGEYVAFLPLFEFKRVELFPDKQASANVVK